MKLLKILLEDVSVIGLKGSDEIMPSSIGIDSRKVSPFSAFVAIRGATSDGHNFIGKAIENGATAIICEQFPDFITEGVTYIKVVDTQAANAFIARAFLTTLLRN